MTYCLNPNCTQPKNAPTALICESCGSKLLLHDRYQTLRILGKGGFGATFVSSDLFLPDKPLCVVKQLQTLGGDCLIADVFAPAVSSTDYREKGDKQAVPAPIKDYIEGQKLYA